LLSAQQRIEGAREAVRKAKSTFFPTLSFAKTMTSAYLAAILDLSERMLASLSLLTNTIRTVGR